MRKMLLTIVTVCLTMLLSGGVWAEARTDLVPVLLGVKHMPNSELIALCGDTRGIRGCATETRVFLQGKPAESTALFKVQYVDTYKTLRAECGAAEPCFKDNTLYTMEYSTRGPRSEYRMGQIGDLLNKEFNLGLSFNGCVTFAQLFMGNLAS